MGPHHQDELNTPLGAPSARSQDVAQPEGAPRRRGVIALLAGVTLFAGAGAWIIARDDGYRGEPVVTVKVKRPGTELAAQPVTGGPQSDAGASPGLPQIVSSQDLDPQATGSVPGGNPRRSSGTEIENASGVRVVRAGDDKDTPEAMIIRVPQAATVGLAPAPDPRLVEKSKHGLLPRRGGDGSKPMEVYARPLMTAASLGHAAPQLALMVGGMGLSQSATRSAIEKLPPAVTLGFAPYGKGLAGQVSYARGKGHEIILQAPMEAIGLGDEGPGPHMLRAGDSVEATLDNLHWLMSRYSGYTGIANFLGARFLAEVRTLGPVMNEINKRGLFFFDDASAPRSVAASVAQSLSVPFVRADVVIDLQRDGASIDAALVRLETIARERGSAIGVASALPDVVTRIAAFAKSLERRGIALAPVSAIVARQPVSVQLPR